MKTPFTIGRRTFMFGTAVSLGAVIAPRHLSAAFVTPHLERRVITAIYLVFDRSCLVELFRGDATQSLMRIAVLGLSHRWSAQTPQMELVFPGSGAGGVLRIQAQAQLAEVRFDARDYFVGDTRPVRVREVHVIREARRVESGLILFDLRDSPRYERHRGAVSVITS